MFCFVFPSIIIVNYGGEAALAKRSSPINHIRLNTAPTNGEGDVSGAERDVSAEQKMHCIPTGIA